MVERTVDACSALKVIAEWQDLRAPEQKEECNYTALDSLTNLNLY
ncbi:hypothetical protein LJR175_005991 [Variovorax sp. LjRoot175]